MVFDFGSSKSVAVGDGKYGAVALGLDNKEKALHFPLWVRKVMARSCRRWLVGCGVIKILKVSF